MTIEIRIDCVVLMGVGIDARHAEDVREALQAELIRLIVGTPTASWRAARRSRFPVLSGVPVGGAEMIGIHVAKTLHRALVAGEPR